jgi:hypothetical protein
MEDYKLLNIVFVSLTLAVVIVLLLLTDPGINNVFSQPISSMNNSMPAQQHANHTFDNLIVSEHIHISSDAGATFGDKVNLSNTTASDSQDAEISADGSNVVVTWWERNQTSDEPAAKISTDNGQTFGPVLKLATNGTIGEAEGTEEGE